MFLPSKLVFASLFVCALFSCQVFAWGSEGHQLVANVAQSLLSKDAEKIVNIMTGGNTLAYLAPLADDYDHSSAGTWSKPCHYVNLPQGAPGFEWSDCPGFCVVQSINNYTAILKEEQSHPQKCNFDKNAEPCALEFLVHYAGDIHQPMHASYAEDKGGNSANVLFFGSKTNLHSVWDGKIISKWCSDLNKATQQLLGMMSKETVKSYSESADPVDWANESYQIVKDNCYNYTMNGDVGIIDQEYYDTNLPVIQQRLIAGGVRLANILNTLAEEPILTL
mmetsp:Transcript_8968/g.12343  ORF Transcript_8968/g.12343 Transcript_8968/m.12343 type:complete len:279 (-) Transcript_8968:48-884(-)